MTRHFATAVVSTTNATATSARVRVRLIVPGGTRRGSPGVFQPVKRGDAGDELHDPSSKEKP